MKKRFLYFLFVTAALIGTQFLFTQLCRAQPSSIFVEVISGKEGLSHSHVTGLIQDNQGFLWVATRDGLNRYDGYNFKIFQVQKADSLGIPENTIGRLFKDSSGFIWITAPEGRLIRFDPKTNSFNNIGKELSILPDTKINEIVAVDEDSYGNVIISGHQKILTYVDASKNFQMYETLSDSLTDLNISAVDTDKNGNIWIVDREKRLIRYHVKNREIEIYNPSDSRNQLGDQYNFSTILSDQNDNLWLGGAEGIHTFNVRIKKFQRVSFSSKTSMSTSEVHVSVIYEDAKGVIWAGTDRGLFRYNQKLNSFEPVELIGIPDIYKPTSITSILSDKYGVLWVGTEGNGLLKHVYSSQNFQFLPGNAIVAAAGGSDGEFWMGTRDGLIKKINKNGTVDSRYKFITSSAEPNLSNKITALFRDKSGDIWAGAAGGLNRIRNGEISRIETKEPAMKGVFKRGVSVIYEDRTGVLWVGATAGNLYKYDRNSNEFKKFEGFNDTGKDIEIRNVSTIYEDVQGDLWIGTRGYGLFRFQRSLNKIRHYTGNEGLSGSRVYAIVGDRQGVIWLGTNNGLTKFDVKTESITSYSTADGLPKNEIHGLLRDEEGSLWLSTNAGLAEFEPETLTINVFDKGDGMPFDEFRKGVFFKNNLEKMYFGGNNGIIAFQPDSLQINKIPPDVVLNGLYTIHTSRGVLGLENNNVLVNNFSGEKHKVNLRHDQNSIHIRYTALHFVAPLQNRYMYKLEGYNNNWQYVRSRDVVYTNLKAGEYTFKVSAANKHGIWSEKETDIKIAISAPFWATSWAYATYFLIAVIAAGLVMYMKNRGKKYQEADNNLAATNFENTVKSRTEELEAEKNKSDQLLYNMLPYEIADEIKETGHATPRRYEHVTVVFTDFENFTEKASTLSAKKLVDEINEIFEAFDIITKNHGLEKIKTIGDAYMAVCGLPNESEDHAVRCVEAAMEMLKFIEERNNKAAITWNMRVGMHSGNVIAGVVGKNKFTYDIWGNTVIIASRMEEAGIPGTVNVSSSTYELIKNEFKCELRVQKPASNKGDIDMYLIKSKN